MLLRHLMQKTAKAEIVDQRDEDLGVTRALASTMGKGQGLMTALMINPRHPIRSLDALPKEKAEKVLALMQKQFPGKLDDVRVNLGGSDVKDTIIRAMENERRLPGLRVLEALTQAGTAPLMASMSRADHFNPLSNTIDSYMGDEGVLAHELGHAVDINDIGDRYGRLGRLAYEYSRMVPGADLIQEYRASKNAIKAVGEDPEAERRYWNVLAPAFGTYAGGAAALLHHALDPARSNKQMATRGLGYLAGGVAAGHGVAALRNALAKKGKKKDGDKKKSKK